MITKPATKYVPFRPFKEDYSDRTWPSKSITKAPIWLSTDLRDGNQALIEPMNIERKISFFEQLLKIGFKEIEVGFPSASKTEFDFTRKLIEDDYIPDDVTISVLTQSREDLIRKTIEAVYGAKRAIVHLYNACAPSFRKIVFNMNRDEIKQIAVNGTNLIKDLFSQYSDKTLWQYEYSIEVFSSTELEFALDVANTVIDIFQPTVNNKLILNLPATVESSTPNIYADQIEWMKKNINNRDNVIISVHPHNDRGTAVASAELAIMAGADRVEGCLFGHGERTGNVDLITLALNLYTQGIHPELDFSDIDEVRRCVEHCTQMITPPRHPYAGDLVFTAFSGSHQDAIKKGMALQKTDAIWEVPYLPIDPADLGRNYDAVIRVNSQSGKGGVAYLLEREYGLVLPRKLQIEFSRAVQRFTDKTGREVTAEAVYNIFKSEYLDQSSPWKLIRHRIDGDPQAAEAKHFAVEAEIECSGEKRILRGEGNGAISAFISALGLPARIMNYHEHSLGSNTNTRAACYVELRIDHNNSIFGVGIDRDIVTASFRAVLSAINRHLKSEKQS
ncbi:2-isopropylmalate synthase [Candidatus Kinetoplastibacterium oncopeltii TCC290E]|uniref:2-isopropylmalate synthase n=1 Tax=Candidatus Kinetoplastidibacterium stringomonadis TCC290E TaxID=1208920 RepID=M1LVC2_9PROT|nr:2-isopropylmalate synthase [Candidatus Kinetoplastibacterium oncopeltii]AGF48041.1 2-isopropylmalate synthase [Candidatus Kinetoplastibacterium oncopeltii TCC290E]